MRIVSLLPSITEILFELALGDQVVGVTHECDWPPPAVQKPRLTKSRIAPEALSSGDIDRRVREQPGSLYDLDVELLARLKPDVILTQSLCPVCAVDENFVRDIAAALPHRPDVHGFHPRSLAEAWQSISDIAALTGAADRGAALRRRLDERVAAVRAAVADAPHKPITVCLEWTNPPFACGHWTPELVELAGAIEPLGRAGQPSRSVPWSELIEADPEVLVVAPCGFTLERTGEELTWLAMQPGWNDLRAVRTGRVYLADGSSYFNRPGPRLVETLEILAAAVHPEIARFRPPVNSFHRITHSAT